jgi:ethanolamine utilization microcompartment shell protein EutL
VADLDVTASEVFLFFAGEFVIGLATALEVAVFNAVLVAGFAVVFAGTALSGFFLLATAGLAAVGLVGAFNIAFGAAVTLLLLMVAVFLAVGWATDLVAFLGASFLVFFPTDKMLLMSFKIIAKCKMNYGNYANIF